MRSSEKSCSNCVWGHQCMEDSEEVCMDYELCEIEYELDEITYEKEREDFLTEWFEYIEDREIGDVQ